MADIKRVSPEQAKQLIDEEGYLYLDVRSEPEYAAGHPSGAHNVPLLHAGAGGMTPNPDFLAVVTALYPKDAKIVVGCRSGQRSMRAAEAMVSAGYTAVVDQRAGFEGPRDAFGALTERGWGPAGLPVATNTPGGSYAELRQKAGK
ncbi:rhodanese-like domain-containing protein [Sorangium cellulosum]|uniref:Rhodanese-like domain-containing protein n=1 Tax=Sorangium cellulosum TaxID=56 RepID=A0A4P2PU83_SORCE|nr:rhodanese-like domain-containing protein [Sorangium cellulosum]AUX20041.1 rhodanese-like domain-containing protein [Sorangium cellulosum]